MKALFMWFLFLSFLKFLFPFNLARVDLSLFEAFSSEGSHSGFGFDGNSGFRVSERVSQSLQCP